MYVCTVDIMNLILVWKRANESPGALRILDPVRAKTVLSRETSQKKHKLELRPVGYPKLFSTLGGFHVTSSPPCWWTKTKDLSLAPFVRPSAIVHYIIVICVSRCWLQIISFISLTVSIEWEVSCNWIEESDWKQIKNKDCTSWIGASALVFVFVLTEPSEPFPKASSAVSSSLRNIPNA